MAKDPYVQLRLEFGKLMLNLPSEQKLVTAEWIAQQLCASLNDSDVSRFDVAQCAKEAGLRTVRYRGSMAVVPSRTALRRWLGAGVVPVARARVCGRQPPGLPVAETAHRGYLRNNVRVAQYLVKETPDGQAAVVSNLGRKLGLPTHVVECAAASIGLEVWHVIPPGGRHFRRAILVRESVLRKYGKAVVRFTREGNPAAARPRP